MLPAITHIFLDLVIWELKNMFGLQPWSQYTVSVYWLVQKLFVYLWGSLTISRGFRIPPDITDLDSSQRESSVGEAAGRGTGREERGTPGLFSHLWLNQHPPHGIGHLLTAQVTVVEAEVTGVRGGRRADVKLVAEVHVWMRVYVCVVCHACLSLIQDLNLHCHHKYHHYDIVESRILALQITGIPRQSGGSGHQHEHLQKVRLIGGWVCSVQPPKQTHQETLDMFQHLLVNMSAACRRGFLRHLKTFGSISESLNCLLLGWRAKSGRCVDLCVCVCVAYVLLHVCTARVTGGESGRHYHRSAQPTIRRHLTAWDNHRGVREVTTSTMQQRTKGEHVGG